MNKEIRRALEADEKDAYNTAIKWLAVPCIATYIAVTLMHSSSVQVASNDSVVYTSRDTGLQMTATSLFSHDLLAIHLWSGIGLCFLVLFQKYIVSLMSSSYKYYKDIHCALGFFILLLSLQMSIAGFFLGFKSALPNFLAFSVLFAAPWVIWAVTVWWSASAARIHTHRLLGNMMVKGCLAVPLSRVSGAYLQKYQGEVDGYYTGIIFASTVVGVWQVFDCWLFWRDGKKPTHAE